MWHNFGDLLGAKWHTTHLHIHLLVPVASCALPQVHLVVFGSSWGSPGGCLGRPGGGLGSPRRLRRSPPECQGRPGECLGRPGGYTPISVCPPNYSTSPHYSTSPVNLPRGLARHIFSGAPPPETFSSYFCLTLSRVNLSK